jgi:hypothetical protein
MSAIDRFWAAIDRLLEARLAGMPYLARYEYKVQGVHAGTPGITPTTIDCVCTDVATAATIPRNLAGVVLWPGSSGVLAIPKVGSLVRIAFTQGAPEVVGLDPRSIPQLITLGGPSPVPACLSTVNDANMSRIVDWLTSHTHPAPGGTTSPSDLVPPVTGSTAAQIVKIQ